MLFYPNKSVNGIFFLGQVLNVCKNWAPVAPSITRWSQNRDNFIVFPTTICPFFTIGFSMIAPTDKIAGIRLIDDWK